MTRNYENQPPTAFQRLPDYARDDDWIRAFLREQKVGHTAYAWDDQPFLHPNLFWFDEENHQIIFHGNIAGRIRSSLEKKPKVCLEVSEMGKLMPSNIALEFALQYRSVMVFGTVRVLDRPRRSQTRTVRLDLKIFPRHGRWQGIPRNHRQGTAHHLRLCHPDRIVEWQGKLEGRRRAK